MTSVEKFIKFLNMTKTIIKKNLVKDSAAKPSGMPPSGDKNLGIDTEIHYYSIEDGD